jgi:hypothetical protein
MTIDSATTVVDSGQNLGGRVEIDQKVIETLVSLVRRRYPDWGGFDDKQFVADERSYKLATIQKAIGPDGLLAEGALRSDLDGGAYESFIKRLITVGNNARLLFLAVPADSDLRILHEPPPDTKGFCAAVFDLLYGQGPSIERLARYISYAHAEDLKSLGWAFVTYFLFVCHPDEDMFVKPQAMSRISKHFDLGWSTKGGPSSKTYSEIINWCRDLRTALVEYGPKDMVDIQSMLWVASRELKAEAADPEALSGDDAACGCWKIAPGEKGWNWADCRDSGYIGIGWEDLGDLSDLTHSEYEARRDALVAEKDDWTAAGTDQAWRFAHDIHVGDKIVANLGKSDVLGIGRVTGPYEFTPEVTHGHRLPVEWYDLTQRHLSEPKHGFQRTVVKLDKHDFDEIAQAPPADSHLAPPFDNIFRDTTEANWALDEIQKLLTRAGITGPDDERLAVTLPSSGPPRIHVDFLSWLVFGIGPASTKDSVEIPLPNGVPGVADAPQGQWFAGLNDGEEIALRKVDVDRFRERDDLRKAYDATIERAVEFFKNWTRSPYRDHHHVDQLGKAIFNPALRAELLSKGLEPSPSPAADDSAFDPKARQLLAELSADPTMAFYSSHRDELSQLVMAPVQRLLKSAAAAARPEIRMAMETEKRLFSQITKQWRNGVWDFYWGALYPKGGKRTTDAQLFVSVNKDEFYFGFSIGNYGGDQRARLDRNCKKFAKPLTAILSETMSGADLHLGGKNKSEGGHPGTPLDFSVQQWLESAEVDERTVYVQRDWPSLLALPEAALVSEIAEAFDTLFPLVLLSSLDEPLPPIEAYLGGEPPEINEPYSLEQMADETGFNLATLQQWVDAIHRKRQAILYGPPGTGKTYIAQKLAAHIIGGGDGRTEIVQFHPAYAYEDFIQGIRPESDGDTVTYPMVPGRFLEFCEEIRNLKGDSVLLIDEINRAELSRVFGELMYLLEYRGESVRLASGRPFSIPLNLRIIGTMNTADRSIALVDNALRRRFAFLDLYPDPMLLDRYHERNETGFDTTGLNTLLRRVNNAIGDPHFHVGVSFFMDRELDKNIEAIWKLEIEPYLDEYFFNRKEDLKKFRWDKVAAEIQGATEPVQ